MYDINFYNLLENYIVAVFAGVFLTLIATYAWVYWSSINSLKTNHKKSIEALTTKFQSEINQHQESIKVLKRNSRSKGRKIRKLSHQADELQKSLKPVGEMRQAIESMKNTWLNNEATEEQCRKVLEENMWVFWPEYKILGDIHRERSLPNVITGLFPDKDSEVMPTDFPAPHNNRFRIDLCGWTDIDCSLQPGFVSKLESVLLLIELKRPKRTIDNAQIQQAWAYVTSLVNMAASEFWYGQKPVDCLVIGGKVKSGISNMKIEFDGNSHGAIRIIPLSYELLYRRALALFNSVFPNEKISA